jgi:Cytochrome c
MRLKISLPSRRTGQWRAKFAAMFIAALAGCGQRPGLEPNNLAPAPSVDSIPADRGRMIYLRGESGSEGVISARIGDGPELPATTLACVQCHGADGRGRTEGGVTPSDIRWEKLARASGPNEVSGRRRPAYTDALLARAITMGWDSSGQSLVTAMPRYKFAPADLSALIAYMKSKGNEPAPGVSESAIRIGIVLPDDSKAGTRGEEILRPISEHIRGVNDSGGIFRRRLELSVVEDTRGVDSKVFAVLGGFAPDADRRLADIEATRVPTVRVYAEPEAHPPTDRRESFSLMPGHVDQVRSLVRFAIDRKLGFDAGIAVIHGHGQGDFVLAEQAASELQASGARSVVAGTLPRKQGITTLLLTDADDSSTFEEIAMVTARQTEPITVLAPEAVGSRLIAMTHGSFSGRLFVATAVPSWLGSSTPPVLAAVTLLTEGLKRSGRELDRESFVSAMEQIAIPGSPGAAPIAFGPGRRIGIQGTCIVRLEFTCKLPERSSDRPQR